MLMIFNILCFILVGAMLCNLIWLTKEQKLFVTLKRTVFAILFVGVGYLLGNSFPTFKVVPLNEVQVVKEVKGNALPVDDKLNFDDEVKK